MRTPQPRPSQKACPRRPQKRALLIGIGYWNEEAKSYEFRNVHRDVDGMKDLLIEQYGYEEKDIVILLDDVDGAKDTQPTRVNILKQIDALVKDVRAKDRLFFYYSGHSGQVRNYDRSEEDGKDEYIVPCNSNENDDRKILDDELKQRLVDPLPVRSKLTAVFDSCHSASLLDLKHCKCNRVYLPWVNKGKRDTKPLRNRMVRRDTLLLDIANSRTRRVSLYRGLKKSPLEQLIDQALRPSARSKLQVITKKVIAITREDSTASSETDDTVWYGDGLALSPLERTQSPEPMYCTGECKRDPTRQVADVITISSCKDSEKSWEVSQETMTQALIEILATDPHPQLRKLMTNLGHRLHANFVKMHQEAMEYKREMDEYRTKVARSRKRPAVVKEATVEADNFQEPQLSSQNPLEPDRQLSL